MRFRNKEVFRKGKNSVVISPGNRPSSGIGFITMPNDIDRETYFQNIKRTGYCQIITDDQIPINQVLIPLHLIDQLVIPLEAGIRGSMVSWMSINKSGQVILNGIHLKPGETHFLGEAKVTNQAKLDNTTITEVLDPSTGTYSLNVTTDKDGSIVFNINGNKVSLKQGEIKVNSSDSIITVAENSYKFQLGTEKGKISTLELTDGILNYTDYNNNHFKIDAAKASLEAPAIELGTDATEHMVLGDKLFNILTELISTLQSVTVLQGTTILPLTPNSSANLGQIQSKLSNFLSTSITVK